MSNYKYLVICKKCNLSREVSKEGWGKHEYYCGQCETVLDKRKIFIGNTEFKIKKKPNE